MPGSGAFRRDVVIARVAAALRGPVGVYLAAHGIVLAVALWITTHHGVGASDALGSWDGIWYAKIARTGYEHHVVFGSPGVPAPMKIAFFPLLPFLMRAVSVVSGLGVVASGVLVSAVAGVAAAAGIYTVLVRYIPRPSALIVVGLWAALPPSYSQSTVYTESLYTALSVWALHALLKRRWLTAAALTSLSGLCRSTAFTLIAVVCVAALIELERTRTWRPLAAIAIAPLGLLGYIAAIGLRTGRMDAWFLTEKAPGWENSFDFGRATIHVFHHLLNFDMDGDPLLFGNVLVATVVAASAIALFYTVRERRLPWPLVAWTVASVLFTLMSSGNFSSKARYVMPYFPLLVPFATALRPRRFLSAAVGIACLAVIGGWYGAFFMGVDGFPP